MLSEISGSNAGIETVVVDRESILGRGDKDPLPVFGLVLV